MELFKSNTLRTFSFNFGSICLISLIDNSESLEETSSVNNLLRKSEINQINMNSKKDNLSKKLTTEEELYDEFNYLLDE